MAILFQVPDSRELSNALTDHSSFIRRKLANNIMFMPMKKIAQRSDDVMTQTRLGMVDDFEDFFKVAYYSFDGV